MYNTSYSFGKTAGVAQPGQDGTAELQQVRQGHQSQPIDLASLPLHLDSGRVFHDSLLDFVTNTSSSFI